MHVDADTWALASECTRCNRGVPNLCCITNTTHNADNTRATHTLAHTGVTVRARIPVDCGRNIATLHANNMPSRWMVVSRHWWPQPHNTLETHANCEWLTARCRHCGRHEANLYARRAIHAGEELTVPRTLAPRSSASLVPYEVFFDGGTCNRHGGSATGAGALLWYIHSSGPPTCIARAIFAAPGDNSAAIAESHACGLGLSLLTSLAREHWSTHGSTLRARLVGACIPVIRYASAQSRFRSADQRAHIDHGLRQTSEIGWGIEWQAVNRRHNSHAHALARIATIWANDLYREGGRDNCSVFEWRGLNHTLQSDRASCLALVFCPAPHASRPGSRPALAILHSRPMATSTGPAFPAAVSHTSSVYRLLSKAGRTRLRCNLHILACRHLRIP